MEFQNISTNNFDLELTIVNNGEADLENCYILPIRYGDEYLDCIPKIINQPIKTGISKKIILTILKPDIAIEDLKGYFRMFTPEGLPFGNVIFIKVLKNS